MKNYLALAKIQAKAHQKQNVMTMFCIVLAVLLITGVFSMSDMEWRHTLNHMEQTHGNWHIAVKNVPEETAIDISRESKVESFGWYDVMNYYLDENIYINGKKTVVCGYGYDMDDITKQIIEGNNFANNSQIYLSENAAKQYNIKLGQTIKLETPSKTYDFTVCAIVSDGEGLLRADACGAIVTKEAFEVISRDNNREIQPSFYYRFNQRYGIQNTVSRIKEKYGLADKENLSENTAILGVLGASTSNYVTGVYGVATLLVVLVVAAGVFMISGSMNSNVAERTQYFGMLRCVGASKRQIKRLVIREALSWCKFGIPIGEIVAIAGTWAICAVLKYGIGGEWSEFPTFEISYVGIACGAVIGIITVIIAANSPAKRAAKVSPIEAVSGNTSSKIEKTAIGKKCKKIDVALGIKHALGEKKSVVLMAASFALSIILFLSFSVMIEWIGHALTSTRPYSQDLSIYKDNFKPEISRDFVETIKNIDGTKYVYGRMHKHINVDTSKDVSEIDLISYDVQQFEWAKDDLIEGNIDLVENGNGVIIVFTKTNQFGLGDIITINGESVTVEATLSDSPFSDDGTPVVICSEKTFESLIGTNTYSVIDVQVEDISDDAVVNAIRNELDDETTLSDVRLSKKNANDTYLAFSIVGYGFLAIIAMISVFNIINSISLSVTAKTKQYGVMRAIGIQGKQIKKMISLEALTYAVLGCLSGTIIGLPLNAFFYKRIIKNYWGTSWNIPYIELAIIIAVVILAVVISVDRPTKKIVNMTITDTINAK